MFEKCRPVLGLPYKGKEGGFKGNPREPWYVRSKHTLFNQEIKEELPRGQWIKCVEAKPGARGVLSSNQRKSRPAGLTDVQ